MNSFPMLIRREFWEHRPLWIAPLAVSACIVLLTLVASAQISTPDVSANVAANHGFRGFGGAHFLQAGLAGVLTFQMVIAAILIGFYLLDCLFSERKDRSILFWKSLPVSDTSTVLSKFTVGALVIPFGVFILAGVTSLIAAAILFLRFDHLAPHLWDLATWGRSYAAFLVVLIAGILWYAPAMAYLMLISAWARRSAFLWAILPPLVLMLLEIYAFESSYVQEFLRYRLGPPPQVFLAGPDGAAGGNITLGRFVTLPGLWLGLVAAGLLLFAAVRIRRFRDDT